MVKILIVLFSKIVFDLSKIQAHGYTLLLAITLSTTVTTKSNLYLRGDDD